MNVRAFDRSCHSRSHASYVPSSTARRCRTICKWHFRPCFYILPLSGHCEVGRNDCLFSSFPWFYAYATHLSCLMHVFIFALRCTRTLLVIAPFCMRTRCPNRIPPRHFLLIPVDAPSPVVPHKSRPT